MTTGVTRPHALVVPLTPAKIRRKRCFSLFCGGFNRGNLFSNLVMLYLSRMPQNTPPFTTPRVDTRIRERILVLLNSLLGRSSRSRETLPPACMEPAVYNVVKPLAFYLVVPIAPPTIGILLAYPSHPAKHKEPVRHTKASARLSRKLARAVERLMT